MSSQRRLKESAGIPPCEKAPDAYSLMLYLPVLLWPKYTVDLCFFVNILLLLLPAMHTRRAHLHIFSLYSEKPFSK